MEPNPPGEKSLQHHSSPLQNISFQAQQLPPAIYFSQDGYCCEMKFIPIKRSKTTPLSNLAPVLGL